MKAYLPVLFLLLASSDAVASEGEAWLTNTVSVNLSTDWQFRLRQEIRTSEIDYDDTIDQNFAIGVSRGLPKGAFVGVFYRRGKQRTSSGSRTEDRYYLDLGWTKPISWVEFSGRLRTELRTYRRNAKNDVLRFRFRVRLRPAKDREIGMLQMRPFIWTEIFTGHEQSLRNRFSAGTTVEISCHVRLLIAYIRQDERGSVSKNVLQTGLELSF